MLLFIPYSAVSLKKIPFITYTVIFLCIIVFIFQTINKQQLEEDIADFCQSIHIEATKENIASMNKLPLDDYLCKLMIKRLEQRADLSTTEVIRDYFWFDDYTDAQIAEMTDYIDQQYSQYKKQYTQYLNKKIMYFPLAPDLPSMFTSVLAHGDIWHLLGNIIFMLAFSPVVEILLSRSGLFLVLICLSIVTTSISYSLAAMAGGDSLPALGLSGVVMTMIGLYAALMPHIKVRLFVWVLTLMKTYYIPAWILAAWYIGFDILELVTGSGAPGINLVAHISGALVGFISGLLIKRYLLNQAY